MTTFAADIARVTEVLQAAGFTAGEATGYIGKGDFTFTYSNYEVREVGPTGEKRNYRNLDNADPDVILEHATRRGQHLEVSIHLNMGLIQDYPEDADRVLALRERAGRHAAERAALAKRHRLELEALEAAEVAEVAGAKSR